MSKDAAIAEIVKNLHNLNLEENQQILDFINSKKDLQKKKEAPKHRDKDGTILETGDERKETQKEKNKGQLKNVSLQSFRQCPSSPSFTQMLDCFCHR